MFVANSDGEGLTTTSPRYKKHLFKAIGEWLFHVFGAISGSLNA